MAVLQPEIKRGVEILRRGGVIAFPTDTVYGVGADAFNPEAAERIYEIKSRPRHLPLPLLAADLEMLATLTGPIPEVARILARRFWPGGLTLILPKADSLPAHLGTTPGIAVRIPNHPVCLVLMQCLGGPIVGTSANISGRPPALTAREVERQLAGKVDYIIDGGKCPGGKESTVADVTLDPPVVLREGLIPSFEVEQA